MTRRRVTYADLFDCEDGFDEELFAQLMDEPLPRPAPVPDADRALAAAIAVRMDADGCGPGGDGAGRGDGGRDGAAGRRVVTPESKARVWLWCAYLMRAELADAEYRRPRASEDELDMLELALGRFYAKADEVVGRPLVDDDFEEAARAFDGAVT